MNKPFQYLMAAGLLVGQVSAANAQQLIGSLQNRGADSTNYYKFQNNGPNPPGAGGSFYTTSNGITYGSAPVTFVYNVSGTPFGGSNIRAFVNFTVDTTSLCTNTNGVIQEGMGPGTVRVTVDPNDPTYGGQYGGQTLLNVSFQSSGLRQDTTAGNPNPTFGSADPNDIVQITSPFLNVTDPERFTFSYSSGSSLSCDPTTNILSAALLGGSGNFSARTVQGITPQAVPEPGTLSMLLGTGVTGSLMLLRRRRK